MSNDNYKSPFLVDLVAENERIEEENRVRRHQHNRRQKALERKREEIKNDIILRALEEANELESLRREKRRILEEEKRIKALMELEKTNACKKQDRIAAERAERKRQKNKTQQRRALNKARIEENHKKEVELLRIKHKLVDSPGTK